MKASHKVWWRRLWRRYPQPVGATARFIRGVSQIRWRSVIDSIFRYLQMVTVLTILVSLIGIVDQSFSKSVKSTLSIAAGLYLGIPVADWIFILLPAKARIRSRGTAANSLIMFSTALTVVTMTLRTTDYLQALLSATVRIDEDAARRRYAEWHIADREKNCVIAGARAHVSEEEITRRCFQHREQPVFPHRKLSSRDK